jgi:hypothetical protein
VAADDVAQALLQSNQFRPDAFGLSFHEKLIINERKIPLALRLGEALADAKAAAAFQRAHLEQYGEIARVPLPLGVLRWPDAVVSRFRSLLLPHQYDFTREIIESLLDEGLGCYAYYYPGMPIRVRDVTVPLGGVGPNQSYRSRLEKLRAYTNPETVVSSWLDLLVRMLGLGYLPCRLGHHTIGNCLQWQNAVIDGGVVDADSIQPLSAIRDDRELRETLLAAIVWLSDTVHAFLLSSQALYQMTPTVLIVGWQICSELQRRIEESRDRGTLFDERITDFFHTSAAFQHLDRNFAALFPTTTVTAHGRY